MTTEGNVEGVLVPDGTDGFVGLHPDFVFAGAFCVNANGDYLHYVCPCGCGEEMSLPIAQGEKRDREWQWDGDRHKPTITPSIKRLDRCKFHGHLTAGVWTFAGDSGR